VGQDLADVVAAGVQNGEYRVADGAFQGAPGQAAVRLHVADICLDCASTAQVCGQFWRQAAPCAADQDAGCLNAMSAISAVDDGQIGTLVCQDRHLFEGLFQGVAVVRIASKAAHADHKALVQCGDDADLATKFIAHSGLALRDAVDLGFMQGVDLIAPLGLLMQQQRHQGELVDDPVPQVALGDVLQVAA
jgi:hypothetical protein